VVQALGCDLAGMIDAHEAGHVPALAVISRRRGRLAGRRAETGRAGKGRAQAGIGEFQQPVERGRRGAIHLTHII
jgi:hypothetical protein